MRVTIERQNLLTMTSRIHGCLSEKNFSQLGLRTLGADKLQLSFKDRIMSVFCEAASQNEKDGTVFVQARLFADMVRELPPGMVSISSDDNTQIVVTAGKNREFVMKLPLIEDMQWQNDQDVENISNAVNIPSAKLSYMLEQVQFCINQESSRNYGTVGFLHRSGENRLRLVGTDGFRLSFCEIELESKAISEKFLRENGACISKRGLNELLRMSNEGFEFVKISFSDDLKTLVAEVEGYKLTILLSTMNFPNYQGVIPDYKPSDLKIGCQDLQSVLRRVLLASDKNRTLKMTLKKGELKLSSRNVGNFEGQEVLDMENYTGPGGSLSINGKFLSDIISSTASESINIRFKNDDAPVLIVPLDEPSECHSQHVLVPIKEGSSSTH